MLHAKILVSLPEAPRFLNNENETFFWYHSRYVYTRVDSQQAFYVQKYINKRAIRNFDEINMNIMSYCTDTCQGYDQYVTEHLQDSYRWVWLTATTPGQHRIYVGATPDLDANFFFIIFRTLCFHYMLIQRQVCAIVFNYWTKVEVYTVSRYNSTSQRIKHISNIHFIAKCTVASLDSSLIKQVLSNPFSGDGTTIS